MNFEELLDILACPKCRGNLELLRDAEKPAGFLCGHCSMVYPIRDEIPIMLQEAAIPAKDWQDGSRGE